MSAKSKSKILASKVIKRYRLLRTGITGGSIRLDASSMCQLKCPICSTGKKENMKGIIGWGYLKFSDYKNLIEKNRWIKNIELSNWGEIFLNPDLEQIITYSHHNNIKLKAGNGVNLNTVSESTLEVLVKYKFRYISVSIDGASNDTYLKYRRNGHFEGVIENIKKINYYKNKLHSEYPKLNWQFVVFGHNEHELPEVMELASKLSMSFKPKLSWDPEFSPIKNDKFVKEITGMNATTREEYANITKTEYITPCRQLWNEPQINWDGKLLGCCVNRYKDFGNAFQEGLVSCLKSEKYKHAKKMLSGKAEEREDIPCSHCPTYKKAKGKIKIK